MTPFGPGSVSVGLHPMSALTASAQVRCMIDDACAAQRAGFDGVTISEHHAGFAGYMPQPLLAVNWLLSEVSRIWAAPAPVLLGLRSPVLLAEELAWTAARFEGRLGAGLAMGYSAGDFEAIGVSAADSSATFGQRIDGLLDALRADGPLAEDSAIADRGIDKSVLLRAVNSAAAATGAASAGLGMLFPGGETPQRLAGLVRRYRQSGGSGPAVGIAAVWIGGDASPMARIESRYVQAAGSHMRQASGFGRGAFVGSPDSVAAELVEFVRVAGLTALNLRFRSDRASAADVLEQIELAGASLLPMLTTALKENSGE